MRINWGKAVLAGIVGTLVMTAIGVWVAPVMGIPRMNPAEMLAQPMGSLIGHLVYGAIVGVIYGADAELAGARRVAA